MRSVPLVLAIALLAVGWATGGGAAQILFTLFGEVVFNRGAAGIGTIWGCAGLGLLLGGSLQTGWENDCPLKATSWRFSLTTSYTAAHTFFLAAWHGLSWRCYLSWCLAPR